MGIKGFWEAFKSESQDTPGTVVNLFELAAGHIERNSRPYRVAVDAAYWIFKNLDDESIALIRESSKRASNPNEKAILYRAMRLDIHGIEIVLVFDGPNRPEKRGRLLSPANHTLANARLKLLKDVATQLGIACWRAPAEAEAECARMQKLQVVDAVWSEDSDVFMFGCERLFRFRYENNGHKISKSNTFAHQVLLADLRAKCPRMDSDGAILFAVIAGGDYCPDGLLGLASKVALEAVSAGLGTRLVKAFREEQLNGWRHEFNRFLIGRKKNHRLLQVFPSDQMRRALGRYINPMVSPAETLKTMIPWGRRVDQHSLRTIITRNFNFSVQEYISWVVRMLVSRRLRNGDGLHELGVDLAKRRSGTKEFTKKELDDSGHVALSRIKFLVEAITPGDLLRSWPVKDTIQLSRIQSYEHEHQIECIVPSCIVSLHNSHLLSAQNSASTTNRSAGLAAANPVVKSGRGRPRKATSEETKEAVRATKRAKTDILKAPSTLSEPSALSTHHDQNDRRRRPNLTEEPQYSAMKTSFTDSLPDSHVQRLDSSRSYLSAGGNARVESQSRTKQKGKDKEERVVIVIDD